MTFYLVGPFYPLRGGIAQYLGVLGQKLQQKGHRVKALSFRKQFPRWLFPGQTQMETSRDHIELDTTPVFIPWNPITWWKTFRLLRRDNPDAVIFKYWMPFFAPGFAAVCALTKWFTDVRTIYILDNVIPHERHPGDKLLTRAAFKWVDGFIAQSEVVRRDLLLWFPQLDDRRIKLAPHPVYDCYRDGDFPPADARRQLNLPADSPVLLFFGLVRRYKGLDILLEAMPEIVQQLGNAVRLVIAGEFYDPVEKYQRIISDAKLDRQVIIVNQYIPNEEVGLYFRAADLLVLPYRSATQSGVIQVAGYYRLPVISTRVGGLPEIVKEGENGYLVPPKDPARLAEAVCDFFQKNQGKAFRERMPTPADGWDEMIKSLEDFASCD